MVYTAKETRVEGEKKKRMNLKKKYYELFPLKKAVNHELPGTNGAGGGLGRHDRDEVAGPWVDTQIRSRLKNNQHQTTRRV